MYIYSKIIFQFIYKVAYLKENGKLLCKFSLYLDEKSNYFYFSLL